MNVKYKKKKKLEINTYILIAKNNISSAGIVVEIVLFYSSF